MAVCSGLFGVSNLNCVGSCWFVVVFGGFLVCGFGIRVCGFWVVLDVLGFGGFGQTKIIKRLLLVRKAGTWMF